MPAVRRIEPHEWPKYRELRRRSLQDAPDAFGSTYALEVTRPNDLWASRIRDSASSGKDLALFAQAGDELCGLAWCKIVPENPAVANLFQMWVAPEHRQRGLGGRLLTEAIEWAGAAGARVLRLGVTDADSPALHLYASRGFVQVGPLEPLRPGSELLAKTMELVLSEA